MSDPADTWRFVFAGAFQGSAPAPDCPDPELLLDTLARRAPGEVGDRVVDHLSLCPVCAEAWRLATLAGWEGS